jgi:predicted enzyme related to lactoylglutathione lyase
MPAVKTVLYPVSDLAAAKAAFTTILGVAPVADAEYYVGWNVDGQDIGLVPAGPHAPSSAVTYLGVEDIAATYDALVASGLTGQQPPTEVGPGRQVATLVDADGNVIGLQQG